MSVEIINMNAWVWRAELRAEQLGMPQYDYCRLTTVTPSKDATAFALARLFRGTNLSTKSSESPMLYQQLTSVMENDYGLESNDSGVILSNDAGFLNHITEFGLFFNNPGEYKDVCRNKNQFVDALRQIFEDTIDGSIYEINSIPGAYDPARDHRLIKAMDENLMSNVTSLGRTIEYAPRIGEGLAVQGYISSLRKMKIAEMLRQAKELNKLGLTLNSIDFSLIPESPTMPVQQAMALDVE